ncbi:MAG: efflux RND transporter periplasmic adaptor subunit [Cytophagaceae bacterium]
MKTFVKILCVAVVLSAAACKQTSEREKKEKQLIDYKKELAQLNSKIKLLEGELNDEGDKGVLVEIDTLIASTFEHFVDVHGTVEADMNIQIMPETSGMIQEIKVEKGQKVSKGQVLAVLNTDIIRQNIKELETNLELATRLYEKQANLWKQNIGSELQYLEAKNRKDALENNLASLKTQLSKSYIKSPVSGEIDELFPRIGESASPQAPFARVVNVDKVYITADVSEKYIGKFGKGDDVLIHFPSLGKDIKAKISAAGQFINPNNRTFKITVRLDNKDGSIKPNMLSVLKIKDTFVENALVVPVSLIQDDSKGSFLFIAETEDGKTVARKTYVKTGTTYKGNSVVKEGLTSGDVLITQGFRGIVDGEAIIF